MLEVQEIKQDVRQLQLDFKDAQRDIRTLETRTTVNEREITNINKTLDKINNNTTWILRIIIAAIITALFSLLIKGGV